MLNVVVFLLIGDFKVKKKVYSELKYFFEELSDEEESLGKILLIFICSIMLFV